MKSRFLNSTCAAILIGVVCIVPMRAAAQTQAAASSLSDEKDGDVIIVTAQRRSESALDVPLSISSIDEESLTKKGVTDLSSLSHVSPGMKIDNAGNYVQPAMRGVAAVVIGPGTDAPVAIYLDGIYQANQLANHFEFPDVDRIEVVKGPQGTLFGRNATGGAVSIFTKAPSFDPHAMVSLGAGNYELLEAKAFATGPLSKTLAASISLYSITRDGYNYDIVRKSRTRGLNSQGVRLKLLWQPSDTFEMTLIGLYATRMDGDSSAGIPLNGNSIANLIPNTIITTKPWTIALNTDTYLKMDSKTITVRSELSLDAGTFTSLTGYARHEAFVSFDEDRTYNPNVTNSAYIYPQISDTFSQELTFASKQFGIFSFVAGANYFYDDNRFWPNESLAPAVLTPHTGMPPAPVLYPFRFAFKNHNPQYAWAVFGETTFDLTDKVTLIAGLRYSHEIRKNRGQLGNYTDGGLEFGPVMQGGRRSFNSLTPRVSLSYALASDTNVYATFSQGFKSGGVSGTSYLSGITSTSTWAPEKITAYELGVKSRISPAVSFNLAGYYYDYKDLQVQVNLTAANSYIQNAATARIYGVEGDLTLRPINGLMLNAGANIMDASYRKYENATALFPVVANGLPGIPDGTLLGNLPSVDPVTGLGTTDASGNSLPRAPKVTLTGSVNYDIESAIGTFGLSANVYYSSRVYFDSVERVSQPAYTLVNGQITYRPNDSGLRIEIFGRNLTNKPYLNSVYPDATTDGAGYGPPRTYGVRLVAEI